MARTFLDIVGVGQTGEMKLGTRYFQAFQAKDGKARRAPKLAPTD